MMFSLKRRSDFAADLVKRLMQELQDPAFLNLRTVKITIGKTGIIFYFSGSMRC
jgi:hypothetical protein